MHYLNQIHKGIVVTLGYFCIVFLVMVGAAEMVNRWRLAEGVRPFFQRVVYELEMEPTPAPERPRR